MTYNVLYKLLERLIDLGEVKTEEAKLFGIRGKGRVRYCYMLVSQ